MLTDAKNGIRAMANEEAPELRVGGEAAQEVVSNSGQEAS
jgi:hypothetical protein